MAILIGSGRVSHRFTVAAGATEIVTASDSGSLVGLGVGLKPGVAGTALCQYRLHADDGWKDWPGGTVDVETTDTLNGPVQALLFTATATDAVVSIAVGGRQ